MIEESAHKACLTKSHVVGKAGFVCLSPQQEMAGICEQEMAAALFVRQDRARYASRELFGLLVHFCTAHRAFSEGSEGFCFLGLSRQTSFAKNACVTRARIENLPIRSAFQAGITLIIVESTFTTISCFSSWHHPLVLFKLAASFID